MAVIIYYQCSTFTGMGLFGKSKWQHKRIKSGIPYQYHTTPAPIKTDLSHRVFSGSRAFAACETAPSTGARGPPTPRDRRMRRTTTSRFVSSERGQGCTHACHMQCHKQRAEGATCQTLFTCLHEQAAGSVSCSHAHCRFFADQPNHDLTWLSTETADASPLAPMACQAQPTRKSSILSFLWPSAFRLRRPAMLCL